MRMLIQWTSLFFMMSIFEQAIAFFFFFFIKVLSVFTNRTD